MLRLGFVPFASALAVVAGSCTPFGSSNNGGGGSTSGLPSSSDGGGTPGTTDPGAADASSGFCARQSGPVRICDDFDVGVVGSKWTRPDTINGATLSFDETAFRSAPRSLRVRMPEGCREAHAQLIDLVPSKPRIVKLAFSVEILERPTPALSFVVLHYTTAEEGYYNLSFGLNGNRAWGHEVHSGSLTPHETTILYREEGWHQIEIELRFQAPARMVGRVDGETVIDEAISPPEPTGAFTSVDFGGYVGGECDRPLDLRYDNLVYEFMPR